MMMMIIIKAIMDLIRCSGLCLDLLYGSPWSYRAIQTLACQPALKWTRKIRLTRTSGPPAGQAGRSESIKALPA